MKVLLVSNMYPQDWAPYYGIFVKEQELAIKRKYNDVEFIIYFIDGKRKKINYIRSIKQIHNLIKTNHFDLIHVHYGFSGLFLLKKLPYKIPVIVTLHGGDIQIEQKKEIQVFFTKLVLKKADKVITLNPRMDHIVRQYTNDTSIIPCSVNTDFFQPYHSDVRNGKKKIIFPSNKTRFEKNYPLFEQVIMILKTKYELDCVTYEINNMSRQQVLALYQSADLMLMTSISEGSPQVVKEAMACNLPVVSTNVGDVITLLDGVKNSAVARTFDKEELADLCNMALKKAIPGIEGREKIFQLGIDDNHIATQIYSIYKGLTNKA